MATARDVRYNALVSSYLYGQAVIRWANSRSKVVDDDLAITQIIEHLGNLGSLKPGTRSKVLDYLTAAISDVEVAVSASRENVYAPPADVALLDVAIYGALGAPNFVGDSITKSVEAIAELLSGPDALILYPYVFQVNVVSQPVGEYIRGGLLAMAIGVLEKNLSELVDVEEERPSRVPMSVSNISELLLRARDQLDRSFGDDDSLVKDISDICEIRNSIVHREGRIDSRLLGRFKKAREDDRAGAFISVTSSEIDSMVQKLTGFGLRAIFGSWLRVTDDRAYLLAVMNSATVVLKGTGSPQALSLIEDLSTIIDAPST